jgi:two-component system NtrC family sensor kinase
MLLKQLKDKDPRREDFQMIANEATRCKNIVRGLLDFARQSRISKAPTDLTNLINEVQAIMAPKAEVAGVHLTWQIQDEFPTMMIDEAQIKQMLVNLMENGMDAITNNVGEVAISAYLNEQKNSLEIEVKDNGCGIPHENLSKLFTPFFTTKEMGKGTGLGLAIAYGIVKMHSGDIAVKSEEGKGTTFSISLPIGDGN